MSLRRMALACGLLLASACTSMREAPLVELSADHFVGTIHTGALARPAPDDLGDPAWFEVRVAYTDAAPTPPLEPISARARQVFVETGGEPLRARSTLALGIVLVGDGSAIPRASATELRRADPAWRGTTIVWRTTLAQAAPGTGDPPRASWKSFDLELTPGAGADSAHELALVLEAEGAPREHLVLDPPAIVPGGSRRIFLSAPREQSPAGGFLVEIRALDAPAADASADAVESATAALHAATTRAREGSGPLTRDEGFRFESSSALHALEDRSLRRSSLVFLAQSSGATTTAELAIGAELRDLESYLAALSERARGEKLDAREASALGWILESTTLTWLAARCADAEQPPAPELRALLLVRTGALARFPDIARECVAECADLETLRRRFADENRIFLEDADPAARLRAFEWLRERGTAPEGFDPLGPLAERRAALDRAREREAAGK